MKTEDIVGKWLILHDGTRILNADYAEPQTGHLYAPDDQPYRVFATEAAMNAFASTLEKPADRTD